MFEEKQKAPAGTSTPVLYTQWYKSVFFEESKKPLQVDDWRGFDRGIDRGIDGGIDGGIERGIGKGIDRVRSVSKYVNIYATQEISCVATQVFEDLQDLVASQELIFPQTCC